MHVKDKGGAVDSSSSGSGSGSGDVKSDLGPNAFIEREVEGDKAPSGDSKVIRLQLEEEVLGMIRYNILYTACFQKLV